MSRTAVTLIIVWAALLALLAATVAATFAPLGSLKAAFSLAIAGAKAGLILWFYMHLREQSGLMRVFALGVIAWLVVLFALTSADVLARRAYAGPPPPETAGSALRMV